MEDLGNLLLDICQQAKNELLLVAPFMKLNALKRILEAVGDEIPIQCVTRWRPDEIAAGVSDIDIWLLIKERANASLWLRTDLHAKYYRGDQRTLVGSANLTGAALGWSHHPNLELLIESNPLGDFESKLFAGSVAVDDDLYEHTKQSVNLFPQRELLELEPAGIPEDELASDEFIAVSPAAWIPILRHPEKLYIAYIGDLDQLGSGSRVAAIQDLAAFDIPSGLERNQFEAYIGQQLLQKPIIRKIDQFVKTPKRFGAVCDYLDILFSAIQKHLDAVIVWQTLMRWLTFYLSERYQIFITHHSEIFSRKDMHHV